MAGDEAQLPALRGGGGSCADSVERDLGAVGVLGGAGRFPCVSARHAEVSAGDALQ